MYSEGLHTADVGDEGCKRDLKYFERGRRKKPPSCALRFTAITCLILSSSLTTAFFTTAFFSTKEAPLLWLALYY
jgi:hypothetical protein